MPSETGRPGGPAAFIGRAVAAGKLAGGYVIVDPAGRAESGSSVADAAALEAAAILLCRAASRPGTACGECRDCRLAGTLAHPDLYIVHALPAGRGEKADDGPFDKLSADQIAEVREALALKAANPSRVLQIPGASSIKLSSIRELRRRAAMAAVEGAARVVLILDADLMTTEASNALLKTLEEPSAGLTIILTTAAPSRLLPTVLSRCQVVSSGPPARQPDSGAGIGAGAAEAGFAAADEAASELAVELLRTFLGKSELDALTLIDKLEDELDRAGIASLLGAVQSWLRRAMIASVSGAAPGAVTVAGAAAAASDDALGRFVKNYPKLDYPAFNDALEEAVSDLSKNVYIQLVLVNLRIDLRRISAGNSAVGTRLRK
jgi:DNA polymerase-3 subunit delta'